MTKGIESKRMGSGFWGEVAKEFKKNTGAIIGLVVFALIILAAVVSIFALDYKTQITKLNLGEALQPSSLHHIFGTDQFGRDIFLRILYGAHYSLLIGVCAVIISTVIGSVLGIIAGYFGGFVETVIMRIMDIISPCLLYTSGLGHDGQAGVGQQIKEVHVCAFQRDLDDLIPVCLNALERGQLGGAACGFQGLLIGELDVRCSEVGTVMELDALAQIEDCLLYTSRCV